MIDLSKEEVKKIVIDLSKYLNKIMPTLPSEMLKPLSLMLFKEMDDNIKKTIKERKK